MIFNNHLMHGMQENAQAQDAVKSFPGLGSAIPEAFSSMPSSSAETVRQNILNVRNPAFNLVISDDLTHILQKQQNIENKLGKLMEPTFKSELGHMARQVSVQVFSQVFSQLLMAGIVKGLNLVVQRFSTEDPSVNPKALMQQLNIEIMLLQKEELKQKILMNQQNQQIEKSKYLVEEYKRLEEKTYDLAKKRELQEKQQEALDKIEKMGSNKRNNKLQFMPNPISVH